MGKGKRGMGNGETRQENEPEPLPLSSFLFPHDCQPCAAICIGSSKLPP